MARKLFDLAVKTGEYTTQSGETKARWQNVGSVFEGNEGGQFILLSKWFNPAGVPDLSGKGGDSIILSCFEPRQDAAPQQQPAQPQRQAAPAKRQRTQYPENSRTAQAAPAFGDDGEVPF